MDHIVASILAAVALAVLALMAYSVTPAGRRTAAPTATRRPVPAPARVNPAPQHGGQWVPDLDAGTLRWHDATGAPTARLARWHD